MWLARFALKLGYRDGDPWHEKWGMNIGLIHPQAAGYFVDVYAVREWDKSMAVGGNGPARGCVVMELVGDGYSLQVAQPQPLPSSLSSSVSLCSASLYSATAAVLQPQFVSFTVLNHIVLSRCPSRAGDDHEG